MFSDQPAAPTSPTFDNVLEQEEEVIYDFDVRNRLLLFEKTTLLT